MTDPAAIGELFRIVLRMSLAIAIVVPLALALRSLLGNRRDPRLFHALWIALAARMLVPWSPPLASGWRDGADGLAGMLPPSLTGMLAPSLSGSGARPSEQPPSFGPPAESGGLADGAALFDWLAAAGVVWLAGAAAVAALTVAAHWRFRADVLKRAEAVGADERDLRDIFDECREKLGVRMPVGLRIVPDLPSPAALGLRKPVVLIPRRLVGRLGREEWTCVFAHELVHVRRRDALWNTLMTAFAAAHWFNPLAWIACRAMREDQELACDAVLGRHVNPVQYGRMLARAAELQTHAARGAAIPFLSGRSKLTRRRMEMLFARKRTALTLIAVVCILAAAAVIAAAMDPASGRAASGPGASDPDAVFAAPVRGTITFKYGEAKKYNVHAVSIAAEEGTPVYAAADGVVAQAGYAAGDGNRIAIAHGGGYESVYNHLQQILVEEGAQVKRGQLIGTVGSTGNSTGPHLSFELQRDGEFIDPESVIDFDMPRRE